MSFVTSYKMSSSKCIFLVGTILLLYSQSAQALTCTACDPSTCVEPECVGGVVRDPCQCCKMCAKQAHESCGGMFAIYGQCDMNLTCITQPNHGDLVTGNEPGICKLTEELKAWDRCQESAYDGCNLSGRRCVCGRQVACSNPFQFQSILECNFHRTTQKGAECADVQCNIKESPNCPEDSVLVEGYAPPGQCCPLPSRCECRPERCSYNLCPPNSDRVLVRRGNKHPGTCCDIYQCQPIDECASVRCAFSGPIKCSSDSEPVRDPSKSKCCPGDPVLCLCRQDACVKPKCSDGRAATVTYRGDNKPGSCCDEYSCTRENRFVGCSVNGTRFEHGSSYQREGCSVCECKNGLSHCEPQICPPLSCTSLIKNPGACCPQCLDDDEEINDSNPPYYPHALCKSDDESMMYTVGETWSTDQCTYCKCEAGGVTRCTAAFCQEPPLITVTAPTCLSLQNCTLSDTDCPFGYKYNVEQCRLCECSASPTGCPSLADCTLACPMGHQTDEQGCKKCQCRQQRCKDVTTCMKQCPYGYKPNVKGCGRCRCRRCPAMDTCRKQCTYGLAANRYGCEVCKCRDEPIRGETSTNVHTHMCTDALTNRRHDDGETWSSGCYLCVCRGGVVMCNVVKCPVPLCDKPVIKEGDCCATCAGSKGILPGPLIPRSLSCQFTDGTVYVEGDTWTLDQCTSCTCQGGNVMCTSPVCLPTPCNDPVYEDGDCCPKCLEAPQKTSSHPLDLSCIEIVGKVYESGMIYWHDPCTSCICLGGISKCFSQTCPQTHDCDFPVLKRGECCPRCLGKPRMNCDDDGEIRNDGEQWNRTVDGCTTCLCRNGKIECHDPKCKKLPTKCRRIYKRPGTCCDECVMEEASGPYVISPSPPGSSSQNYVLPLVLGIIIACVMVGLALLVIFYLRKKRLTNPFKTKFSPGSLTSTSSSEPSRLTVSCSNARTGSVGTRTMMLSTSSEDEPTLSSMDN